MKYKLQHGFVNGRKCTVLVIKSSRAVVQCEDHPDFGWNESLHNWEGFFTGLPETQRLELRGWHFDYSGFKEATKAQQTQFFRKYPFLKRFCQNDIRKSCI